MGRGALPLQRGERREPEVRIWGREETWEGREVVEGKAYSWDGRKTWKGRT